MRTHKLMLVLAVILVLCMPINAFAEADISQDANTQYFKDISKYGWAKDSINYFARAGVFTGDGKGNYSPGSNVTREEFASMLANAFNSDIAESTQTFSDVATTRWSYKYIESVKEYLTGYYPPKGKPFFDPTGDATREDVAVALAKMLGLSEDDLGNKDILDQTFTDADDVSFNLRGLMGVVVEKKIMVGNDGLLRPTAPITRAEVAVLLYKVMKSSVSDASEPLELELQVPETINTPQITVSGTTAKGAKVKINGYDAEVTDSGYFERSFTLKKEGQYSIEVVAVKNGRKAVEKRDFTYAVTGPKLVVTKCPSTSTASEVTIEGTLSNIDDFDSVNLTINDEPVYFTRFNYNSDIYKWSYKAQLEEGNNEFKIVAEDGDGKQAAITKTITYTAGGPELVITQCPETSASKTITIAGNIKDANDSSPKLYVNNKSIYVRWDGSWSEKFTLAEGKNTFVIKATNSNGKSNTITKEVIYNVGGPELIITQCPETSTNKTVTIAGTIKDPNDSSPKLYVNNKSIYVGWDGSWSEKFTLAEGKNTFVIKATNSDGKATTITKEIAFSAKGPEITFLNCPETTEQKYITIQGNVKDSNDDSVKLYIDDKEVKVSYYSGSFSKDVTLAEGDNTFVFRAVNSFGKTTSLVKTIKLSAINAPVLNVNAVNETTTAAAITITGTVQDSLDGAVKVYINDNIAAASNGSWTATVALKPGDNNIIITATNKFGKSATVVKKVTYSVVQ